MTDPLTQEHDTVICPCCQQARSTMQLVEQLVQQARASVDAKPHKAVSILEELNFKIRLLPGFQAGEEQPEDDYEYE